MKNKKVIFIFIFIATLLMLNYKNAIADGGVFKPKDNSSWYLFNEQSQLCFINYQNETQKMLINVALNDKFEEEKALWLFPIPAKPNEAKIDILNSAPMLRGDNLEIEFGREIGPYFEYFYKTQIYTTFLIRLFRFKRT